MLQRCVRCHGHITQRSPKLRRETELASCLCKPDKHKSYETARLALGLPASRCHQRCSGKSDALPFWQLQSSHSADTSSNMNTQPPPLKIKVPLSLTIALLSASLATSLILSLLSGQPGLCLWLLLATLTGSLLQACCITFGGTVSCDERMTPNGQKLSHPEQKDSK